MDYKLTFEDGSEALMHHGIKGMKWGVWNSETAARYKGASAGGGGGNALLDESIQEKFKDGDIVGAAALAINETGGDPDKATELLVRNGVESSEEAKQAISTALAQADKISNDVETVKRLSDAANHMSEDELNDLRKKAKEEKKQRKEEERQNAKDAGNPLWFLL